MTKASTMVLTVGLFMLLALPGTALSQGGIEAGWADAPPTLDGTIGTTEWADATRVALTPVEGGVSGLSLGGFGEGHAFGQEVSANQVSGWLYLMNDERYLYVAGTLDIGAPAGDPDYWLTFLQLVFEDEPTIGDGRWAADLCAQNPDEGVLLSTQEYSPGGDYDYDYFVPTAEEDWCSPWQPDPPGYTRAVGYGSVNWEARIDLVTSALQAAPGDCINLAAQIDDCQLHFDAFDGCGAGLWPEGMMDGDLPDDLALVCLAEEEVEFVPEPGSLLLLGGGLASLAGYASLRWRARRKE